jgi:hypothetical protein
MPFDGVSTILPAFCPEFRSSWCHAFRRAVESVLLQDVEIPLELIVVDDGSVGPISAHPLLTDLFKDPRITYVRLRRNNGLVFALNAALNLAGHRLIGRIDSDDAWRPGKLRKQLARFEADPDLTIIGTGMRLVHEGDSGKDQDLVRPGSWLGILNFTAHVGCPFPHGSILARRDMFHLLGGYSHDPRTFHCEDFALWQIWLRFFKAAMVEEVLYEYTVSDRAISAVHGDQQKLASEAVHTAYLSLPYGRIPESLQRLSDRLGLSLVETGKACYTAWRFFDFIVADHDLMDDLYVLMPDRQVVAADALPRHLGDRFFCFTRSSCPEESMGRSIHSLPLAARLA